MVHSVCLFYDLDISAMESNHSIKDPGLELRWKAIDWEAVEDRVETMRRNISLATMDRDFELAENLVDHFMRSMDAHLIAVRSVTSKDATKEVGLGEAWETDSDRMRAVLVLDPDNYRSDPVQTYKAFEPRTKKDRWFTIPTFYDRAMHELMNMAAVSYMEPLLDKRMFSVRDGRSVADAVTELKYILTGQGSPEWIVKFDVKSFYDTISHQWLKENFPIFPEMVAALLSADKYLKGSGEEIEWTSGISTGDRFSPALSRWTLNGVEGLFRDADDPMNGIALAWVDDIIVTARTRRQAEDMMSKMVDFLAERGLTLNMQKSMVTNIREGVDWLGFSFKKVGEGIVITPSKDSLQDYIAELKDIIDSAMSVGQMIKSVNDKYRGFKSQYRIADLSECAKDIDDKVFTMAINAAPRLAHVNNEQALSRFIGKDERGQIFRMDEKRYIKRISDIRRVPHERLFLNAIPLVHKQYFTERSERLKIMKVSTKYAGMMDSQRDICPYCGLPIRYFEEREIVEGGSGKRYAHSFCVKEGAILSMTPPEKEPIPISESSTPLPSEPAETHQDAQDQSILSLDEFVTSVSEAVKDRKIEEKETETKAEQTAKKEWGTDMDSLLNYLEDKKRYGHTFIHISKIQYHSGRKLPPEAFTNDIWWYKVGKDSMNKMLAKGGWYVERVDTKMNLVWFAVGKITWKVSEAEQAFILRSSGPDAAVYCRQRDERVARSEMRPFTEYLVSCDMDQLKLTVADIEKILGHPLPAGASNEHWWRTRKTNHILTAIEDADWTKVEYVHGSHIIIARVAKIPEPGRGNVVLGDLRNKKYLIDAINVRFPNPDSEDSQFF